MNTRKALAAWYKLDPQADLAYNPSTKSGGIRIGNSVLLRAWDLNPATDSGWWRRGTEGQYAGFAIPIPLDIYKDALRAEAVRRQPVKAPSPADEGCAHCGDDLMRSECSNDK